MVVGFFPYIFFVLAVVAPNADAMCPAEIANAATIQSVFGQRPGFSVSPQKTGPVSETFRVRVAGLEKGTPVIFFDRNSCRMIEGSVTGIEGDHLVLSLPTGPAEVKIGDIPVWSFRILAKPEDRKASCRERVSYEV
jgi:hypothetical protein